MQCAAYIIKLMETLATEVLRMGEIGLSLCVGSSDRRRVIHWTILVTHCAVLSYLNGVFVFSSFAFLFKCTFCECSFFGLINCFSLDKGGQLEKRWTLSTQPTKFRGTTLL